MRASKRQAIQAAGANFLNKYYAGLSPQERALIEIDAYLKAAPFPTDPYTHAIGGLSTSRAIPYEVCDTGKNIGLPKGNDGYAYGRYTDSDAQVALEKAISFIAQGEPTGYITGATGQPYERPLAVVTPAGMSALKLVFDLLQYKADKRDISIIVAPDDLYGGTRSLINQMGIKVEYAKDTTEAALQEAYNKQGGKTAAIIFEALTNPFAHVADVDTIVRFAKERNIITVADGTLAPLSRPVLRGVDIDTVSLTKYYDENTAILGAIIVNGARPDLLQLLIALRNTSGAIPGALEVQLAMNNITTMVPSYKTHSKNAQELAAWLLQQPQIAKVYYPGFGEDAQTALADKYLGNLRGGLMTIDLKGGKPAAEAFTKSTKVPLAGYCENLTDKDRRFIRVADSFGLSVTLVNYMSTQMSRYRTMSEEQCAAVGITGGTLRVAVGTQDAGLIIGAFAQALAAIPGNLYQAPRQRRNLSL